MTQELVSMSANSQDFSKVYFQKITRNNGSKIGRSKIGLKMAIFFIPLFGPGTVLSNLVVISYVDHQCFLNFRLG